MSSKSVEKGIYGINRTATTTQTDNTMVPAVTQACTLDGIKGTLCVAFDSTLGSVLIMVYLLRDTVTGPSLSLPTTSAGKPNSAGIPEQNVLWHTYLVNPSASHDNYYLLDLDIKTKRKMQAGDQIKISAKSNGVDACFYTAVWSYFIKH